MNNYQTSHCAALQARGWWPLESLHHNAPAVELSNGLTIVIKADRLALEYRGQSIDFQGGQALDMALDSATNNTLDRLAAAADRADRALARAQGFAV